MAAKGKRGARVSARASAAARHHNDFEPLSSEELVFLWRGVVDDGKLTAHKLIEFMKQVAGVSMSAVQARDLLDYMDANGDGRVGMEDFKNFLSVGRLSETDARSFMWEPKRKFRLENPFHKTGHDPAAAGDAAFTHERRKSTPGLDAADLAASPTPPDTRPPGKRRPQPTSRRGSQDMEDVTHPEAHEAYHLNERGAANNKKPKPPKLSPEIERKVEQALLKYEKEQWDRFIREEKEFKRYLFEQFAGQGEEELHITEYHKMLQKWFPIASWCAPRVLRPADSLAAMEYVQRRDIEERGLQQPSQQQPQEGSAGVRAGAATPQGTAEGGDSSHNSAKMSYGLWLEVLNGKHRPEEHIHDTRSHHAKHDEGAG